MGAFGSILGGFLTVIGLFLAGWATWVLTSNFLLFLLFPLFGLLGGVALGYLNSRKARNKDKYRNEYISYAAMCFAAIIMISIYFYIWGAGSVENSLVQSDFNSSTVVTWATLSGILTQMGLGLVIANSLAEPSSY